MTAFVPAIAAEVFALRPDFRALSIRATGIVNRETSAASAVTLAEACNTPCTESWAAAHLEAWREAFRAFGAKPQRTPCSAEALLKRVQRDGMLPGVNAVVDLYNAVSLRHAIPVGGENASAYVGLPHLVRATGSETFDTMANGEPATEAPEPGEVIWRDEIGVTCRRWNWRQGTRTRLEPSTTEMWFVLEALGPMPDAALAAAGDELVRGLRVLSPSAVIRTVLLHA